MVVTAPRSTAPSVASDVAPVRPLGRRPRQMRNNMRLARKRFDLQTVAEVAAAAGVAPPSLCRHFASKEALAAAMVRLLDRALAMLEAQPAALPAVARRRALLRWMAEQHLRGTVPLLPSPRSPLRAALLRDPADGQRRAAVSARLTPWIEAAQVAGDRVAAPTEVLPRTLSARGCAPVLDHLTPGGAHDAAASVEHPLALPFDGRRPRAAAG
jgi:TetR/AcrR family transcriptional regulator, regulator of autoinduction and epiphytic fitness